MVEETQAAGATGATNPAGADGVDAAGIGAVDAAGASEETRPGGGAFAADDEAPMPRNVVGGGADASAAPKLPQLSEAEWRAQNMPAAHLVVRWGYRNGQIQLLNRRMRNLAERRVGPAMCAWIRERVEWEAANRLRERPNGVVVVDVDPAGEGSVDVRTDALGEQPAFTREMLDAGIPAGLHPWAVGADGCVRRLHVGAADDAHAGAAGDAHDEAAGADGAGDEAENAIDRFILDLATTLGFAADGAGEGAAAEGVAAGSTVGAASADADAAPAPADSAFTSNSDIAGYFATSEEWGLVPCAGDEDLEPVRKLAACFATLWSGKEGA